MSYDKLLEFDTATLNIRLRYNEHKAKNRFHVKRFEKESGTITISDHETFRDALRAFADQLPDELTVTPSFFNGVWVFRNF